MGKFGWTLAILVSVVSCALALPPSKNSASPVRTTSYQATGERVLRHEMVVNSTVEQAWHSFTTTEGLRAWAAPVVEFELKTGGKFHSNYSVGSRVGDPGTIYNTVLSYVPLRMLSFKIGLTNRFPEGPRNAGTLLAVAEFEPIGKHRTKVILSMVGFGTGPEWDQVYTFFEVNNPHALFSLHKSLISGPIEWQKTESASGATK
jgi:uncharacterized protein YndB with AHSA1/START domain